MTIGENIRKIRKAKELTITELSEKTGYAIQHISAIEHNKYSPRLVTAIDFADVFEVSLDELVGREFKDYKKPVEKFPFECCPKCGRVVSQLNRYCSQCGQALDWSDAE